VSDDGLLAALAGLAALVRAGSDVLVASDFDGVLAPLRDDPAASSALPAAVAALDRLAGRPVVHLALVSGRGLDDLAERALVPDGTWLVGSHGAERGRRGPEGVQREDLVLPPDAAATHRALERALLDATAGSTARVEVKPTAVVLHTRTAARAEAARLTPAAVELGERAGADVMLGKDVVELGVLTVTKGDALADLRTRLGAAAVLYAGDDVTDERAFAALDAHDVTVRVGPGATVARFRVADPEAFALVLHALADQLDAPTLP